MISWNSWLIEKNTPTSGGTFKTDANRAALIFEVIGNGLALEKLIDPERVPDDLFGRLMPVLIEAFEAGKL